jgi:hypothetical protein
VTKSDSAAMVMTFQAPDQRWLETRFSVYRHVGRGDFALVGTCGSGDAWGLLRTEMLGGAKQ